MSQYLDQKFLQPQVDQYGSHMVMTNVVKPLKHKHIHLDTKYRDETTSDSSLIDANFTLPDRITGVHTATVIGVDLPFTFYNITQQYCNGGATTNNCFKYSITSNYETVTHTITITPGHITTASLCQNINQNFASFNITTLEKQKIGSTVSDVQVQRTISQYIQVAYNADNNKLYFTLSAGFSVVFDFTANSAGVSDTLNIKNKLGWAMGVRSAVWTIHNADLFGPSVIVTNSPFVTQSIHYADKVYYADQTSGSTYLPYPKYFYIALEDSSRNQNNSVMTPLAKSYNIPKNIIAKVTCDTSVGRGNTIFCSASNGRLFSDKRHYGKTDFQRLRIQLLDDAGNVVDLNGGDLSLTLDIEHE